MNFKSDNTAPAAPEILAALTAVNEEAAAPYGEDAWSQRLDEAFSNLFERDVRVFTVATGTAANAIALASVTPPWGGVLCHREAHIERDEGGAPAFYSGGAKLVLIDGPGAKVSAPALEAALKRTDRNDVHQAFPAALSISQASERGHAYTPEEIAALGAVAKRETLAFHVDGARFANAVAALGCAPADVTWRAGVDLLSFGATKGGALGAEAIVVFDPTHAETIARRRKRGGHLLCKGRYPAAQLLAYLDNGLWLNLARRANALALQLAETVRPWLSEPVLTNQVFVKPELNVLAQLRAAGVDFYEWGAVGSGEARFVVSWNQLETDIEAFAKVVKTLI